MLLFIALPYLFIYCGWFQTSNQSNIKIGIERILDIVLVLEKCN